MVVRIGVLLSAVVIFVAATYAIVNYSQESDYSTLKGLYVYVAFVYGGIVLATIWAGVISVVVVTWLARSLRRWGER